MPDRLELRSADGTLINARRWSPEGTPRADVLLVHGLAEHMGRYDHFGAVLADAGFRTTGVELRGHGHSGGKRGHVMQWSDYVADLASGADSIAGDFYLVAHSMGGLVAFDYLRTASRVRASVVSGPLLGVPEDAPKWKMTAGRLLSRIWPSLPMKNELDSNLVCRDPAIVAAYEADPLVFDTITPRWFTEMVSTSDRVKSHASQYTTPMLLMWGTDDQIVPTDPIAAMGERYGGPIEVEPWQGLYHEIFNEPEKDETIGRAVSFLEDQCESD